MSLASVKSSVKTLMQAISTVRQVETKRGGSPAWIKNPRPEQNYWELHIPRREEVWAELGPSEFQRTTVEIEGWMPFNETNPDTTPTWDALLDAVCTQLRENLTLGDTATDAGLPQLRTNDFQAFLDGTKEIVCHHCVITVVAQDLVTFTTT